MIKGYSIFDCTLREVGYQTGWYFDMDFARELYRFAQGKGIDYVELGFFHNEEADPGRGDFRYCSSRNDKLVEIFRQTKNAPNLKNSHVSSNNFHVSICFHSREKIRIPYNLERPAYSLQASLWKKVRICHKTDETTKERSTTTSSFQISEV